MANFTDVFGVDTVPPSQYGYSFITLITNTEFNWPSSGTENLVSRIMDVSSASVGLSMVMPPANQVSPGEDLLIRNLGMNLFTVKDNSGTVIANVLPSAVVYLYVTDNTSAAGEWGNVAFGVGTSAIDAATLVGYGIKAIGNTLNQSHPILSTAAGVLIDDTYRAQLVNFSGGVATIDLSPAAVLGDDFFTIIRNSGTGTLTIDPYLAETIDGSGSFQMQPGESLILFCSGAAWFTVGYGRSVNYNFTQLVLDVSAGGTFVLSPSEASNKLLTFIGNPVADVEVIVPSVVAVYYILNSLSTPHSVTVKTAIGTGVSVPQGQRIVAISDGTNVYSAQSVAAGSNVSLLDGSVVNPALNFISQTNTGLYKFSTDGLGVAIVGADLAHFETTGTTLNGSSPLVTAKAGPTKLQQHTIPAVPSDTFALLAAPQTLTNKHIEAALNNIETAPSGNLTATELNAALAELEAEITSIGTTPPGGLNTQVQFNDGSSFGGDPDLTWNKTTNTLTLSSSFSLKSGAPSAYGSIFINGNETTRFGSDTSGQLAGFRNILIDADFRINQRGYVSGAALAAGNYGHDRWKAGASGGDYTFTQLASSTQITIASGKSLIQVTEDKNVVGGSYILSWQGTAQARIGLNSATPSGAYAVSPILITGQTAGTVMSVEFNTGTLSKVQLEQGSIATPFEQRPIGLELSLSQRYHWQTSGETIDGFLRTSTDTSRFAHIKFPVTMRIVPSCSVTWDGGSSPTAASPTPYGFRAIVTQGDSTTARVVTAAIASAEL